MCVKKWLFLCLCLIVLLAIYTVFSASAQQPARKVVGVGGYDSSFCHWEENGKTLRNRHRVDRIMAHIVAFYEM